MEQSDIWNNIFANSTKTPTKDDWIDRFSKYLEAKKSNTVVDLGCGRGGNSIYLKEQGFNVVACDFSFTAIRFINEKFPDIQTRCFDMTKEFPDNIKDVGIVLASLSTHYFSFNDTVRLYKNISTMLEPKGYFIFRVNSKKEFELKNKHLLADIIEDDYYLLKCGRSKRYFDINSISALLNDFTILEINEASLGYFGNEKHFIEGVAQKN